MSILKAAGKALKTPSDQSPETNSEVKKALDLLDGKSREPGGWTFMAQHSTYGATAECQKAIREKVTPLTADQLAKVKELDRNARRIFDELTQFANKSASQRKAQFDAEKSAMIISGKPLDEAFSQQEHEAERQAGIDAYKKALLKLSQELFIYAQPLLAQAADAARELQLQELEAEVSRYKRFGIPFPGPTEILRSLGFADQFFRVKSKQNPTWYVPATTMFCNLIEL